ncbi:hypothetical protein RDI58_029944 [Solanum bulbocastanum]|uniref:Uncharacterized protein n=1 Tax=Solanum bulbocastanum TaxID=147425 RepID=A0AAN8SUC6_SOLBU
MYTSRKGISETIQFLRGQCNIFQTLLVFFYSRENLRFSRNPKYSGLFDTIATAFSGRKRFSDRQPETAVNFNCRRLGGSMDQFYQVNRSTALNPPKDGLPSTQSSNDALKLMGSEGKMGAVHEEMKRVSRLPPSSAYATHRMRVLNKILQLLSIQRTTSQDEELKLLFSGLSLG